MYEREPYFRLSGVRARWVVICLACLVFVLQTAPHQQCDAVEAAAPFSLERNESLPQPFSALSSGPDLAPSSTARPSRPDDDPHADPAAELRSGCERQTFLSLIAIYPPFQAIILPPRPSARGFIFFPLPPPLA